MGSQVSSGGVAIATGAWGSIFTTELGIPLVGTAKCRQQILTGGWCPVCSIFPSVRGKGNTINGVILAGGGGSCLCADGAVRQL